MNKKDKNSKVLNVQISMPEEIKRNETLVYEGETYLLSEILQAIKVMRVIQRKSMK